MKFLTKNHIIKLHENFFIKALHTFYKDIETSRTIKENQLAEAERKKQEADNKYKDLETKYNKIIENFEKVNNNLIDKKTILENIKKFLNL